MNRKRTRYAAALLLVLQLLSGTLSANALGETIYENTTNLAQDLTYTNRISFEQGRRIETFALESSPGGSVYPIFLAGDTIYGTLSPEAMRAYAERLGYNVLALVNTDFFSTSTGVPLGIAVEQGLLKSCSGERACVFLDTTELPCFAEKVQVRIQLENLDESGDRTDGTVIEVPSFNKFRTDTGGLYLLDSSFSTVSTRTSGSGWFVRLRILEGEMSVSGEMLLQVEETVEDAASVPIGDGYMILTAAAAGGYSEIFAGFAAGDIVRLRTECSDARLEEAVWACGVGDVLLENGQLRGGEDWDASIAGRNPRTLLGAKSDGTLVCLVADGRSASYSNGYTLQQAAQQMLDMGCVWAVNLDGGGSSAMYLRQPGSGSADLISVPSGGSARKCGAYMLLVTDAQPDGVPAALALRENGKVVLTGVSMPVSALASDAGFMPCDAPNDVAYTAERGTVADGVYTAPASAGTDEIGLSLGTLVGSGTLHVIDAPTDVAVYADGKRTGEIRLFLGERAALTVTAAWNRRRVALDENSALWDFRGEAGSFENGVFTAGYTGETQGTVTVRLGTVTTEIPVYVFGFSDIREHWCKPYVERLYADGIVTGTGGTDYSPDQQIRRGDFMLMLYRAAGRPETSGDSQFPDVSADAYYAEAVAWAAQNAIALGGEDGNFAPTAPLLREQAFAFVTRALSQLGIAYPAGDPSFLDGYADGGAVSEYARTAAATLVQMGAVQGSDGFLDPFGTLQRAQMAKILCVVLQQR